jgi:lysyl-tRNA synthetase, class II
MADHNSAKKDDDVSVLPLESLRQIRLEKLKKIKSLGLDPFSSKTNRTHHIKQVVDSFEILENQNATVCGRLMSWREHGVLAFGDLRDESGKIQLYIKSDEVEPFNTALGNLGYENFSLLDIGDFLEVSGIITKTKRGEISILVKTLRILTKTIRPLPSVHFGLKDEEDRYRQRYVDLVINPELKDLFLKKSKFWNSIRNFMIAKSFVEVETPVLENIAGGADATPFVTHHNALDIDVYLRISMGELWQKRLMVGGFEKTFEIGRQFRNEGMSREHLQDYTQMEFYWAYANYQDSMAFVEEMYKYIANETFGTSVFYINGHHVDLNQKWELVDFGKTIKDKLNIDITKASKDELLQKVKDLKLEFDASADTGRLIDILWKSIRKTISGPAFLVGHPVGISPLAKRKPEDTNFVERFNVLIAGSEVGTGYSELNDPIDQASRFEDQQRLRDAGDSEAQMYDHDFIRALEYGMPPVTGFGVSERLFSFLANKTIRECVLFPLLKPEDF